MAIVLIAAVAGAFVAWRAGYLGSPGPASSPGSLSSPSAPPQSPAAVMAILGTIWNPMAPGYGQKTYSYTDF